MSPDLEPDPRIHPSIRNVVRIPRDVSQMTEKHLRAIFGGDVDGGLMEIYGIGPYRRAVAPEPANGVSDVA